ncbi:MAG: hypothetical protein ACTSYR_01550 [Candidatus Odinarchaeia archaeon]
MGSNQEIKDLQQFFIDTFEGIAIITKKLDQINRKISDSDKKFQEKILQRLEVLENQLYSIKETTELLNELVSELRVLVPVLHLNKLIEETKKLLQTKDRKSVEEVKEVRTQIPTTPKITTQPPASGGKSPFTREIVKANNEEEKGKTPEIVYSDRIPSYIRQKRKPKSIWEGIREDEE